MKAIYRRARSRAAHEGGGPRRDPQHGEHGRREPAAEARLVQRQQGLVITATRAMAVELAPFGIRVVAQPGGRRDAALATFMGGDTPETRAKFLATIPLAGASRPEDLGNAACFLCSDEACDDHRRGDGSGRRRCIRNMKTYDIEIQRPQIGATRQGRDRTRHRRLRAGQDSVGRRRRDEQHLRLPVEHARTLVILLKQQLAELDKLVQPRSRRSGRC